MKQLIVLLTTVILGVFIFNVVAGPQGDSIYSNVKKIWQNEIEIRTAE